MRLFPCLLLGCLMLPAASWAAEESLPGYQAALDGLVSDVAAPLGRLQTESGHKPVRVAVAGIREWISGQRSDFCARVEGDLAVKLKTETLVDLPEGSPLMDSLAKLGGPAADLSQPASLLALAQDLRIDAVLTGAYLLQNGSLLLKLQLLATRDGAQLWSGSLSLPANHHFAEETALIADSRPLTYVAPPLPSPSPTPSLSDDAQARAKTEAQALREARFSWSRINLETGVKSLNSQNETFQRNVGLLKGPYVRLGVADVFMLEFDYWSQGVGLTNVDHLSAFATSISLGVPLRWGPYVVTYAALGGRFEGISVNSPLFTADNAVSYGNNSFFGTLGLKLHRGPWGVDASVSQDFSATYNPYVTARLGAYFELGLE